MAIVTKVAISYQPPMFKFEYTKGRRQLKYHKNVNLATKTFIQPNMSEFITDLGNKMRGSKNVIAAMATKRIAEFSEEITNALIERYSELLQVPYAGIPANFPDGHFAAPFRVENEFIGQDVVRN